MGKKSKGIRHVKRMAEKRRAKAARAALYRSRAGTSLKASKIRRRLGALVKWPVRRHRHLVDNCGNPGCKKCGGLTK